jgi:hypothetical protein
MQERQVLIKLEHEQKISLKWYRFKVNSESNLKFYPCVPRTENLDQLEKKIDEFGEGNKIRVTDNPSLAY